MQRPNHCRSKVQVQALRVELLRPYQLGRDRASDQAGLAASERSKPTPGRFKGGKATRARAYVVA